MKTIAFAGLKHSGKTLVLEYLQTSLRTAWAARPERKPFDKFATAPVYWWSWASAMVGGKEWQRWMGGDLADSLLYADDWVAAAGSPVRRKLRLCWAHHMAQQITAWACHPDTRRYDLMLVDVSVADLDAVHAHTTDYDYRKNNPKTSHVRVFDKRGFSDFSHYEDFEAQPDLKVYTYPMPDLTIYFDLGDADTATKALEAWRLSSDRARPAEAYDAYESTHPRSYDDLRREYRRFGKFNDESWAEISATHVSPHTLAQRCWDIIRAKFAADFEGWPTELVEL